MNAFFRIVFSLLVICFGNNYLVAQDDAGISDLKWYLSDDKTSRAGLMLVNQFWARYIQNNPDNKGIAHYSDYDFSVRRSRLLLYASLKDKVLVFTQIGQDGLTYKQGKNKGLTLFNAQAEYLLLKDKFHVGFGLHGWNGISRYSNSMFTEFLVADYPGVAFPMEGTFDLSGSQLGMYARGTFNRLNYRLSVVKPYETGTNVISSPVTTERMNENFAVKGYLMWQFFDKENEILPYMTMNNLGKGKLLNIGAGFYYHPEAMLVEAQKDLSTVDPMLAGLLIMAGNYELLNELADYYPSDISDIFLAAVDVFLDVPAKGNSAVTSYLGYFYNFYGPNYLRQMSKMNVSNTGTGAVLPQGQGNSEWEVGTGHLLRAEVGYLLPGSKLKSRFQPYGAVIWKNFEALGETSLQFDGGINWLINRHNIKWTLQYSSRPVYRTVEKQFLVDQYKGQVILQTQVYF